MSKQPKVLPPERAKKISQKTIEDLDKNQPNVAGTVQIEDQRIHRFVLKDKKTIPKKGRITVIKWLTGTVAMHQHCRNCDRNVLNRKHAAECSGADDMLMRVTPGHSRKEGTTFIDQVLNENQQNQESGLYTKVARAIAMIYEKCLQFTQGEEGYWSSMHRHEDATGVG